MIERDFLILERSPNNYLIKVVAEVTFPTFASARRFAHYRYADAIYKKGYSMTIIPKDKYEEFLKGVPAI